MLCLLLLAAAAAPSQPSAQNSPPPQTEAQLRTVANEPGGPEMLLAWQAAADCYRNAATSYATLAVSPESVVSAIRAKCHAEEEAAIQHGAIYQYSRQQGPNKVDLRTIEDSERINWLNQTTGGITMAILDARLARKHGNSH
ncbi:hypothetical protein [Novosphingobium sp.]|uniref:hypothetical protein n=1 Tax=Novosphingobium sp. TaxID=1874826 RepID=UPI00262D2496|nr:hypothetical protein [Novosphingobium sp.]